MLETVCMWKLAVILRTRAYGRMKWRTTRTSWRALETVIKMQETPMTLTTAVMVVATAGVGVVVPTGNSSLARPRPAVHRVLRWTSSACMGPRTTSPEVTP
eukprot:Rmarinus@m.673